MTTREAHRVLTGTMNQSSPSKLHPEELDAPGRNGTPSAWTTTGGNSFYSSADPTPPFFSSSSSSSSSSSFSSTPCVLVPSEAVAAYSGSSLCARVAGSPRPGQHLSHHHPSSASGASFAPPGPGSTAVNDGPCHHPTPSSSVGEAVVLNPPGSRYNARCSPHVFRPLGPGRGGFQYREGKPAESPMLRCRRFSSEASLNSSPSSSSSSRSSPTSSVHPTLAGRQQGFCGSFFSFPPPPPPCEGRQQFPAPSPALAPTPSSSPHLARPGYRRHGGLGPSSEEGERQPSGFHPYPAASHPHPPCSSNAYPSPSSSSSSSLPFPAASSWHFGFPPCASLGPDARGTYGGRFGFLARSRGDGGGGGGTNPQSQYLRGLVARSGGTQSLAPAPGPTAGPPPATAGTTNLSSTGRQPPASSPGGGPPHTPTPSTATTNTAAPHSINSFFADSARSCDVTPSGKSCDSSWSWGDDHRRWPSCRFQTDHSASQNGLDVTAFPTARGGASDRGWSHLLAGARSRACARPFPGTFGLRRWTRSGFRGSLVGAEEAEAGEPASSAAVVEALLAMRGRRTWFWCDVDDVDDECFLCPYASNHLKYCVVKIRHYI